MFSFQPKARPDKAFRGPVLGGSSLTRLKEILAKRAALKAAAPKPPLQKVEKTNIFGGKTIQGKKVAEEIEKSKKSLYEKYKFTEKKTKELAKEWTDPKKFSSHMEEKDIKDIKKKLEEEKWNSAKKWEAEKKLGAIKDIFKI